MPSCNAPSLPRLPATQGTLDGRNLEAAHYLRGDGSCQTSVEVAVSIALDIDVQTRVGCFANGRCSYLARVSNEQISNLLVHGSLPALLEHNQISRTSTLVRIWYFSYNYSSFARYYCCPQQSN